MSTPAPTPVSDSATPGRCTAPVLIVAHPGHELRIFGWLERVRPVVCVLTDGSGSGGEARLDSTTRMLDRTSSMPGAVYGPLSDRAIYTAMLGGDLDLFRRLADDLAEVLVARGADCVAGDAVEGYNPSHDVCRLVIDAAVRMAGRARGAAIPNYDFPLVGAPGQCPEPLRESAYFLRLDDAALARKLDAANAYPELAGEVRTALDRFGTDPFRTECLRPVDPLEHHDWPADEVPFYERYGEERVAAGVYQHVLRFREHVLPISDALWTHSERRA
jgi:hypothetical protein